MEKKPTYGELIRAGMSPEKAVKFLREAAEAPSSVATPQPEVIPDPKITREEAEKLLQYFKMKIMVEFGDVKSFAQMYPELASIIYKISKSLKGE